MNTEMHFSTLLRPQFCGERFQANTLPFLNRISAWFDAQLEEDSPLPRVYPTPEGGVEAEWLIGRRDVSIEFDPSQGRVEWHVLNLETNEAEDQSFAFDEASDMQALGARLLNVLRDGHTTLDASKGEDP